MPILSQIFCYNRNMKKIILTIIFLICLTCAQVTYADVVAMSSKSIKHYGIGLLNLPVNTKVYKLPDKNSEVIWEIEYDKIRNTSIIKSNNNKRIPYITYVPSENIALLTVETNAQNGWYNVYINQKDGETGWVYCENDSEFYTYKSLFYKYGKKYGVNIFADIPKGKKVLYSKQSTDSKRLEELQYPKYVNFTVISGNWMLTTVNDMTKQAKVGWFNWRNEDGTLNMFPNFK